MNSTRFLNDQVVSVMAKKKCVASIKLMHFGNLLLESVN